MDSVLAKVAVMTAFWVANADVHGVHRNYKLEVPVQLLIFLHHLVIAIFVFGVFLTERLTVRMHLAAATLTIVLWLLFDGCFLVKIQKEFIKYSDEDFEAIHGTYEGQLRNLLVIGTPVILYDFYKLLM